MIRSGLKSVGRTMIPPRVVRSAALTPLSESAGISRFEPKSSVGPDATASLTCPRIPSSDS